MIVNLQFLQMRDTQKRRIVLFQEAWLKTRMKTAAAALEDDAVGSTAEEERLMANDWRWRQRFRKKMVELPLGSSSSGGRGGRAKRAERRRSARLFFLTAQKERNDDAAAAAAGCQENGESTHTHMRRPCCAAVVVVPVRVTH